MNEPALNSPRRPDVERIVREVLAEMSVSAPASRPTSDGQATANLVLTAKVISLAELENRLDGISQLVVAPGAVVTPAARDELRKHKITIEKRRS